MNSKNHLPKTQESVSLNPAFETANVPVFLASDDNYAPYLGVTLASLLANSRAYHNYDLIVLENGISRLNQSKLNLLAAGRSNVSLRFLNIDSYLKRPESASFYLGDGYVSIATYFRFFAQTIFAAYDKIVYLDVDIAVLEDIANLYEIDLGNNYLGGCRDLGLPYTIASSSVFARYLDEKLAIADISGYVNAGILLFNLKAMRRDNLEERLFARLKEIGTPILHDQDIINSVCQGRILHLHGGWNCHEWLADPDSASSNWEALPDNLRKEAETAASEPKIIHYNGHIKPWQASYVGVDHFFWQYARLTPFYETMLSKINPDYETVNTAFNYYRNLLRYWRYKLAVKFGKGASLKRHLRKLRETEIKLKKVSKVRNFKP